jgi:ATPases involved in chromosome partitioning
VILDAPPVLAVADARIVAQHVGLTLLVAQHTKTTIDEIRATQAELRLVEAPIDGIVINQFDFSRSRYGRYGNRYAYYRSYKYIYKD